MKHIHDILRRSLLRNLGMVDQFYGADIKEVCKSQWSLEFEAIRFRRMAMSFYRYGNVQCKDRPRYDHIAYVKRHCKSYLETGNQEELADAANLLMIEFMRPNCHPRPHLTASDHGRKSYEEES